MNKIFKKIVTVLLAVGVFAGMVGGVSSEAAEAGAAWPAGPEIATPCAIVMEANTGTVLYEKNADEQHYPASITKILTTLLAIENCSMDEVVTFSAKAVFENEGDSSHISRDWNEQMTMEECLYAVMLESANECAFAVAEHIGDGDYQKFVEMMNAKAAELGCTQTHFTNPNGLPDENHVTTCRDMLLISRAALENNTFRQIAGTVKYTIPPTNKHVDPTYLNNHHQMISLYKGRKYLYEGCLGGKTGYTVAAGSTLVTFAERDGMLLICVLMNSQNTHYEDTTALFDYCFANYKVCNVAQNETRYQDPSGTNSSLFGQVEPYAKVDPDASIILPATAKFTDTETEISYEQSAKNVLGTLVYSYGGRQVGTADVVATGVSAATYPFGDDSFDSDVEDSSAAAEISDKGDGGSKEASFVQKMFRKENLPKLLIGAVIVVALVFLAIFLYKKINRYLVRKRRRERRYRVIKENRKWRGHRRGW